MPSEWDQYKVAAPAQDEWSQFKAKPSAAIDYSKPTEPSNLQKLRTGVKDFTAGIGAGAISTGVGAYNLARKIPGADSVLPKPNEYVEGLTRPPDSDAGHAGKMTEQVGEFMIPGGAISKGAKAIEGATAGLRAAPVVNALGRAALEGVSAAGVTGLQTGGDAEQMKRAGLTAGATSTGTAAIGAGIKAVTPTAKRIYQSALKPPLGGQLGKKAPQIVETGLTEGIPTSEAGHAIAGSRIDQLNQQIMDGIHARSSAGLTVDLKNVTQRLNDLKARAANMANPEEELAAINAVEKQFLEGHSTMGSFQPIQQASEFNGYYPSGPLKQVTTSTEIPLSKAQEIKQFTGTDIRKKYGEMKQYEIEAKKALVRGLKEEIESVFPEVKGLNAREGRLIELEESLRRFVNREGNHQLISPFTLILAAGAGTGGLASGHPAEGVAAGAMTALLRMAMENPEIKSKIAIAARRAAQSGLPQKAAAGGQALATRGAASFTVNRNQPTPAFDRGGIVAPNKKRHRYGPPKGMPKMPTPQAPPRMPQI